MANTLSQTDALARIKELQAEADQIAKDADNQIAQKLAEMRTLLDGVSGSNGQTPTPTVTSQTQAPRQAVKRAVKKKGRRTASVNTATATKAKKGARRGRKQAAAPSGGENEKTLRQVIWELHSQTPKQWKKVISDIPDSAKGLKAVECAKIIDSLGLWKSPTGEVSNQISGHYMNFRKEGKMRRGDNFRYEIVPGAELDGPSLDDHGKPIKE